MSGGLNNNLVLLLEPVTHSLVEITFFVEPNTQIVDEPQYFVGDFSQFLDYLVGDSSEPLCFDIFKTLLVH